MSDPEFLAHMWTRAVNCGTECFLSYADICRLQELASLSRPDLVTLSYRDHTTKSWTRDSTSWLRSKRYYYTTMYSAAPSDLRAIVLEAMQHEGRWSASQVAQRLEAYP